MLGLFFDRMESGNAEDLVVDGMANDVFIIFDAGAAAVRSLIA